MSRKRKLLIAFLILLTLFVLAFIFTQSMKNRETSKSESMVVVRAIRPILWAIFGRGNIDTAFVVRKMAHFAEFFVLGSVISLFSGLLLGDKRKTQLVLSLSAVLLAGGIDECIQLMNDRYASLLDVGIDFVGGAIGALSVVLILHLIKNRKKPKKEE